MADPGDDPVANRKVRREWRSARRKLAQNQSMLFDRPDQPAMRTWIHDVDARAEDGDGCSAASERRLMRRRVDAPGKAGHNYHARPNQLLVNWVSKRRKVA